MLIFLGGSISCQNPTLLLESSSCSGCSMQGSWTPGSRAAYEDSEVELGNCGSHGVNGCPGSNIDVKLQLLPCERVLT